MGDSSYKERLCRVLSVLEAESDIDRVVLYVEQFQRVRTILDMLAQISVEGPAEVALNNLRLWLEGEQESALESLELFRVWVHDRSGSGFGIVDLLREDLEGLE